MNLQDAPFEAILSGKKDVEMRLNKNGRENITRGDVIVFSNNKGQQIKVLVLNIKKFPSFKELYASYDKSRLGYSSNEIANPDDMLIYYKQEDIEKYGVLAIEVKLKEN